jgi:hypothetical protein
MGSDSIDFRMRRDALRDSFGSAAIPQGQQSDMSLARTLENPTTVNDIVRRLGALQPESPRRWGSLTAHEMLCHLSDSFLACLGERAAASVETPLQRTVIKWIALRLPLPWPRGVPTMPEVDPKRRGTPPADFERDRAALIDVTRRFVRPETKFGRHPAFGAMSRADWMRWGFRHVDHHLRQFGL